MTWLLVMLGAAIGAPARYAADQAISGRLRGPFPLGTLAVNVAGSFALGLVMGATDDAQLRALLGTGFCGALTTYSTLGHETLTRLDAGHPRIAVASVVLNVVAGAGALVGGLGLAGTIS